MAVGPISGVIKIQRRRGEREWSVEAFREERRRLPRGIIREKPGVIYLTMLRSNTGARVPIILEIRFKLASKGALLTVSLKCGCRSELQQLTLCFIGSNFYCSNLKTQLKHQTVEEKLNFPSCLKK